MEGLERLATRLENIQATESILSALRTIALGNRQLSLNKAKLVAQYCQDLLRILSLVKPSVADGDWSWGSTGTTEGRLLLLVIGSERGLCGAFNDAVATHTAHLLAQHAAAGREVTLMSLGKQTERALRRQGRLPVWAGRLSGTTLPAFDLARQLTAEWLETHEKGEVGAVEVVHNVRRGMAGYSPVTTRLLPPTLPALATEEPEWPPIVETEPLALCQRVLRLWLSAVFYGILLDSAAAEHSARYQLMEGAVQNAQHMIEELRLFLQVARQEAVTAEMLDLASGAGLIGGLATENTRTT